MKKLLILLAFMPLFAFSQGVINSSGNTIRYYWGSTLERSMDKTGLSVRGASSRYIDFLQTNKVILRVDYTTLTSPSYSTIDSVLTTISGWIASYKVDSSVYADTALNAMSLGWVGKNNVRVDGDTLLLNTSVIKTDSIDWYSMLTDTIYGYYKGTMRLVPKPSGSGSVGNADSLNSQPPSYYLSRANHTGTQAISTVVGLQDSLNSRLKISDTTQLWQTNGNTATSPNNIIGTKNNADMLFYTNNSERMRIDSLGTIMIGSTASSGSATQKLQVGNKGAVTTAAVSTSAENIFSFTNDNGVIFERNAASTSLVRPSLTLLAGNTALTTGQNLGIISFSGIRAATDANLNSALIGCMATENFGTGKAGSNLYFATTTTGTSTRVDRLYISGAGTFGLGNGTNAAPSSPTYNLSFASGAAVTIGGERASSGNGFNMTLRSLGGQSGATNANSGDVQLSTGMGTGNGGGKAQVLTTTYGQGTGTTERSPILREEIYSYVLADNGTFSLANARSGIGWITVGDGEEYAWFSFTTGGVVTLITYSSNVTTTATTNDKINIYDGGTVVTIENTFTASKQIAIKVLYNL